MTPGTAQKLRPHSHRGLTRVRARIEVTAAFASGFKTKKGAPYRDETR